MAQYQDIDEYREKKRRQKRNRILLALGFLAAALGGISYRFLFSQK